ncbi:UbiA family prenyltransferase [Parapedobacter deserti]|uniref:UbiA family prenyltransferase n=1 Tax=Parapedobacter deserti TaxID=1912957 RepID=A0ABV7JHT1_9SPHI
MLSDYFKRIVDHLLFSNLFISCCAVAQGAMTYLLLAIPMNGTVLVILGCATLALYNFSMILARPQHPAASPYRRVRWIFRHERSLRFFTAAALLVSGALALGLHRPSFVLLGLIGVLGLAYNIPFLPAFKTGRRAGLRQVTGIKVFYIGLVWALSTVLLPVAEAYHNGFAMNWAQVWQVLTWAFLFVVAITIPFDIRDIYQDRYYGLKTVPVLIGVRNAYRLSTALLLLHGGWVLMSGFDWRDRVALCGVTAIALFSVLKSAKKNEYYYFLLLDGTLIIQLAALWLIRSA